MFQRLNKVLVFLVFSISCSTISFADGSIYSLRGIGLQYHYYGSRATGMGGAIIAILDPNDINWLNPAALAGINQVRFSSHLIMQNLNIENSNLKHKTNYANFNGFMGAFPISSGIGIGFGLQPITKINYSFETLNTIDVYNYTTSVNSIGGLNRAFIASGFKIHSRFQLGFSLSYVFGKADEDWRVNYESGGLREPLYQFSSKLKGFSSRFGAVLNPLKGLTIGGVYETKYNMSQNFVEVHTTSLGGLIIFGPQTTITSTSDFDFPGLWGVGISYQMKQKFILAFDYVNQDWSTYPTSTQSSISEFTNFERISFGFEFTPSVDKFAKFFQRSKYRIGFAMEQPYVLDYSGRELSTIFVTAGLGIPFARRSGSIDLAIEYGKRGSISDNNFEEQIFRLSFYITGSELWFQR